MAALPGTSFPAAWQLALSWARVPQVDLCGHDGGSWSGALKGWLRLLHTSAAPPARQMLQDGTEAIGTTEMIGCHHGNLELQTQGFGGGRSVSSMGGGAFPAHTVEQKKPFYRAGEGATFRKTIASVKKKR